MLKASSATAGARSTSASTRMRGVSMVCKGGGLNNCRCHHVGKRVLFPPKVIGVKCQVSVCHAHKNKIPTRNRVGRAKPDNRRIG